MVQLLQKGSNMIEVLRSRFTSSGVEGDFTWMIEQPAYARTLFVFNDNEEEFYAHLKGEVHSCSAGGGNAAIRPWQCQGEPRAAGVPTGSYSSGAHHLGYSALDDHVRTCVDDAISAIDRLLASGRFDTLAFRWDDETKLGGRIFDTSQDVRDYIVDQLLGAAARH